MDSPPTVAPLAAATIADGLAAAQILDPARLRASLAEFADSSTQSNGGGRDFADFLVQHGLLTPHQAAVAARGEAERLNVGPYLLLDPLPGSGVGTAYRAVHRADRRRYAVRVLPLRSLWKAREAKAVAAKLAPLSAHPTLAPLADADTASGVHYLAWPFAEGETLTRAVGRAPLVPEFAARLFADLADALAGCHAAGVVHGLLKPSGVLIGPDRRVRLLDLGLGDLFADGTDGESLLDTISTSRAVFGRIDYAAPEAILDPAARSPAADAYSFGAVLHFALTGEPPFPDGTLTEKMVAHRTRAPLPVRMRNPRVPTAVAGVIERLLAKAPGDRPPLDDVRDELRAQAETTPEPLSLSVTASKLRDALELSQAFQIRKRTLGDADADGAIDFDLPVADEQESIASMAVAPPVKSRTPPPADPKPVARTIVLPTAIAPPPALVPVARPAALAPTPTPADLPRPVGWQLQATDPPSATALSGVGTGGGVVLPPVVVPPPPNRNRGLMRSISFWKKAADEVQLSVFGPPRVSPGQRVRFVAYAHLPEVSDNVATLCRAMHKDAELLGAGFAGEPVERGAELVLQLSLASAGVAQSQVKFAWAGQPQPKTFEVFVPWESPPGLASGALTAAADGSSSVVPVQFIVLPRGR